MMQVSHLSQIKKFPSLWVSPYDFTPPNSLYLEGIFQINSIRLGFLQVE